MPTTLHALFYVALGVFSMWIVQILMNRYGPIRFGTRKKEDTKKEEETEQRPWSKSEADVDERRALMKSITDNICPNCWQNVMFLEGPCGGASQNIKCPDCGQAYNWCPGFFAERISS